MSNFLIYDKTDKKSFHYYEIEGYVRDRTGQIVKDWHLQGYSDVMLRLHPTCISQMEQIARTLINNHHELCELENIYFSQKLNQKDLNKRLKTCK